MVIGNNIEKQLARYQEKDGDNIPLYWCEFEDCTKETQKEYEEYKNSNNPETFTDKGQKKYVNFEDFATRYCGLIKNSEKNTWGYWHNPKGYWDWYEIGGRWTGFFPLKKESLTEGFLGSPGVEIKPDEIGYTDSVEKKHINFAGARSTAKLKAIKDFAVWKAVFSRYGKPKSWKEVSKLFPDEIGKARTFFWEQKSIEKHSELTQGDYRDPVEYFGFDENVFVAKQMNKSLVPFAFVKDGVWHSKGEMGWFGETTKTDHSDEEWCNKINKLYESLSDDTLLTIVDCHV